MKALLLHPAQDFDLQCPLPFNAAALVQDLELDTLFAAMARGDPFLQDVARAVILSGAGDPDTIHYRQAILKDCLNNPAVVRAIYSLPVEALQSRHKHWLGVLSYYPEAILSGAIELMHLFLGLLARLKEIAVTQSAGFESPGFRRFFAMLAAELDDDYFRTVQDHLAELKFSKGILLSAELGKGNEGANYMLCRPVEEQPGWVQRTFGPKPAVYTFTVQPRDDHGTRALAELRDRGINLVANALAQSADQIDAFLNRLRVELGFYVGCLNLHERLHELAAPTVFPALAEAGERRHTCRGLYDASLALTLGQAVVGNELAADGKDLVIITGANQGGKSTFLRSVGQAQLMLQAGMFVAAEAFHANRCSGLFTHYRRKEDASMQSGKLDEELSRMSAIVDHIRPDALVLFNESFAATNEREGSEIARQITAAFVDRGIKVFFVTHQYEFAHGFYRQGLANALFLRAGREPGGERTYKLVEGEPLPTSFGRDLYNKVFG